MSEKRKDKIALVGIVAFVAVLVAGFSLGVYTHTGFNIFVCIFIGIATVDLCGWAVWSIMRLFDRIEERGRK